MRVCAADGCWQPLDGKRSNALYCNVRCRKRENLRVHAQARKPPCKQCGGALPRRRRVWCSDSCYRLYHLSPEPGLPAYWRRYLERFDRAIRVRTEDAWAACHELAPVPASRPRHRERALAGLLASLEG